MNDLTIEADLSCSTGGEARGSRNDWLKASRYEAESEGINTGTCIAARRYDSPRRPRSRRDFIRTAKSLSALPAG